MAFERRYQPRPSDGDSWPSPHGTPGKLPTTARIFRTARGSVAPDADAAVSAASGDAGMALPDELRDRFEASLGADLSGVRLHTGEGSAAAAEAVGARAYAYGNDIHFGAGQYDPSSQDGLFLIAHEVAHTVQQQGGAPSRQHKLELSSPGDRAEVEADRAASAMLSGAPFALGAAARSVQRETEVTVKGGGHERSWKFDKNGKHTESGVARELYATPPLNKQLVAAPPLYVSAGAVVKLVGTVGDGEPSGSTDAKGTIAIELEGSLGGGGAEGDAKAGIEGGVKAYLAFEWGLRLVGGEVKPLPFSRDVKVDAWMGLVGEAGGAGASIKRKLSSIKLGELHWDGMIARFEYTATADDWRKAAQELKTESEQLARDVKEVVPESTPGGSTLRVIDALTRKDLKDDVADAAGDARDEAERTETQGHGIRARHKIHQKHLGEMEASKHEHQQAVAQLTSQVGAARSAAINAKGKCNHLAAEGKSPSGAATRHYSDGFRLFNEAESLRNQFQAASQDPEAPHDTVRQHAMAAIDRYQATVAAFQQGDAAQG